MAEHQHSHFHTGHRDGRPHGKPQRLPPGHSTDELKKIVPHFRSAAELTNGFYPMTSTTSSSPAAPSIRPTHPFANSKNLLVVIPDDGIDVEEESRLYDELCDSEVPVGHIAVPSDR